MALLNRLGKNHCRSDNKVFFLYTFIVQPAQTLKGLPPVIVSFFFCFSLFPLDIKKKKMIIIQLLALPSKTMEKKRGKTFQQGRHRSSKCSTNTQRVVASVPFDSWLCCKPVAVVLRQQRAPTQEMAHVRLRGKEPVVRRTRPRDVDLA